MQLICFFNDIYGTYSIINALSRHRDVHYITLFQENNNIYYINISLVVRRKKIALSQLS